MLKIICVCGARPNFMKIAPLMKAFHESGRIQPILVHTGQHYDRQMSRLFFDQLNIPQPDINLEVGSASHAVQTAEIMKRFEPVLTDIDPDYVLVVGDVNSTIACGLVAVKMGIRLIHVEAGLRSFDRTMPEEINRILTDSISDVLFVTEQSGADNLQREGVEPDKIHLVGNVMIDTLLTHRATAETSTILKTLNLSEKAYGVITLHRPGNVDDADHFNEILDAFDRMQTTLKLVFPMHPRTRKNLEGTANGRRLTDMENVRLTEPMGYLDFLKLMNHAALVITDSGGIQEEATILGVPCMTLRENTERPVTLTEGTNRLVKLTTEDIVSCFEAIRSNHFTAAGSIPYLWDGNAAQRITEILLRQER